MKTAVIHSYNGMGDLIWHLPYIHAVARQTKEKKVVLFSKKTTSKFVHPLGRLKTVLKVKAFTLLV